MKWIITVTEEKFKQTEKFWGIERERENRERQTQFEVLINGDREENFIA